MNILRYCLLPITGMLASLCSPLSAENEVFNGSFELGTDGFALKKWLRLDTNPKLEFRTLTVGAGAPGCGKNSLRIDNRYAEHFNLISKEFCLKPETTYRASVRMRATKEGVPLRFIVLKADRKSNPRWLIFGKTVTLKKEWQEYSFTFATKTKKKNGHGYFHFDIQPPQGDKHLFPGEIFIDDLRVTEVKNQSPDSKILAAAVSDRDLYRKGEKAELKIKFFNSSKIAFDAPVTVSVTDDYTKQVFYKTDLPVKLAPGERRDLSLEPLPLSRFGGFRVTVSGKDLKTHDGFFAVIGKYEPKPFDVNSDFVAGINGGMDFSRYDPWNGRTKLPYYAVRNAPLERKFDLLKQAGVRLLRDHDSGFRGVDWIVIEPEKGKFDFSRLDFQLDVYKKYNITYFPVIGNVHHRKKRGPWEVPEWVNVIQLQVDSPDCPSLMRSGAVYMPDDKEYYTYIHETVKHLKGRVPVYEITNEPIFFLTPEKYVHELKIAHDAIRKADSDAKISGLSLSSDFSTDSSKWLIGCLKLGALQYCDSVGYHPYWSPQLGSRNPADWDIANLREKLKEYGKMDMPIWNTELYYIYDGCQSETVTPNAVITRFLIDLAEGVVQAMSLSRNSLSKAMLTPHFLNSGIWNEEIPSENLVALNTAARLFERAKCVGKHRYDDMVICYVFRDQNKKLIAAVWNYTGRTGLSVDLSAFRVMDLFGNEEKAEIKPLKKDVPFFLTQGKLREQEFLDKIKNLKPVLENPVSVGELGRLSEDRLFVMLHNSSDKSVEATIGLNGKGLIARKLVNQKVPAKGKIAVEIPVKIKDNAVRDAVLVIQMSGNLFRKKIGIIRNTMIKGKFEGKNFKGTLNFGNGKIRVKLTVQDPSDAGATGKRTPWETDCVELFFDTAPLSIPESFAQAYTKNTFRIFLMPRDGKLKTMGIDPAKCKYSAKCGKDSYTAELEIPAETGNFLGFECKIDDFDAAGKLVGEAQIGDGEKLYARRLFFVLAEK